MEIIYHYTNIDALLGMLQESTPADPFFNFRASYCLFLNDAEERKRGESVCLDLIPEVESELNIPTDERISTFMEKDGFLDYVQNGLLNFELSSPNHMSVYVVSFSKSKDFLPMWGMYAQNGNGIALGFDKNRFRTRTSIPDHGFGICDCIYDIQHERDIIKEKIKTIYIEAKNLDKVIYNKRRDEDLNERQLKAISCYTTLAWIFNCVAVRIKNESFNYENEARFLCQETTHPQFRVNVSGNIVPYLNIPIHAEALKEIIIGPTRDYQSTLFTIKKLLNIKGIDSTQISIIKSMAPYTP